MKRLRIRRHLAVASTALGVFIASGAGEAHKPITSPYTYNEDVFPIVRDRCGRCHRPGGVAPMSLMTYKDAFPWGESIRTELVAGHMPPWSVETAADRFKNAQPLSARELNVLLTWATGGNPVGDLERVLPPVSTPVAWRLGPPDLVLQMPQDFTVGADEVERFQEFTLPVDSIGTGRLRAIDLAPGNPAIVRSASVSLSVRGDGSGADRRHASADASGSPAAGVVTERVLAVWVPGDDPVPVDNGAGFALPAGANLLLRIHYKKTWEHERQAMTDRGSVGLYFAKDATKDVLALPLIPDRAASDAPTISFTRTIDEELQALAIYPDPSMANAAIEVTALSPDGARVELIRFRPQPDWARRYWFAQPIALPKGTRVTVAAAFDEPLLPPGAAPLNPKRPDRSALRLTLNVVSSR
jgi:hypothetical protein